MSGLSAEHRGYAAIGELYHRLLTGMLLAIASRAGPERGGAVVFRSFRRQQLEKFLPGLEKLGLTGLPHAVACAQYHYLSNALGGAKVEWIPESDRKSWVRYLPPRWIFDGTAVCGIPTEMSRAMMLGWHANNGVLLGNPRLGFVCTSQTTDGGPGAVGYYIEENRDLSPDERLRFRPGETPPGPAGDLPTVAWSEDRLAKIKRSYAMEYVRSLLPAMFEVLGTVDAAHIARTAARQIGMQFHDATCAEFDADPLAMASVGSFAALMARMLEASGEKVAITLSSDGGEARVRQTGWRFGGDLGLPPEGFDAWNGLWEGMASIHGKAIGVRLLLTQRMDLGDPCFEWRIW